MTIEFLEEQIILLAIVAVVTAIVVLVEHLIFGRRWARNEIARRVMGHATILAIIGIPALLGKLDYFTWLVAAVATIIAGGMIGAIEVTEKENRKARNLDELRKWAASYAPGEEGDGDGADREQ